MSLSPWGGSEELWSAVAREALSRGHEVGVSTCRWDEIPPRIADLKERGATIFYRPRRGTGPVSRRLASFESPFRAATHFKPDVTLVSQGGTYDVGTMSHGRQLREMLRSRGAPYMILCHGNDDRWIPSDTQRNVMKGAFGSAAYIGFVSPHLKAIVERQLVARLDRTVCFSNPVAITGRDALPWPGENSTNLAVVARLDGNKGIDVTLDAVHRAASSGRKWSLSVFGEGPLASYYRELTDFYGITDRVQFKGHTSDVRAVWQDHHALVISSRTEGVPIAMVEAMLCGRPVIATDVGGISDWVVDGKTGFLAEAPTTRYVTAAIERALLTREDWEHIGATAHELARSRVDGVPGAHILDMLCGLAGVNEPLTTLTAP